MLGSGLLDSKVRINERSPIIHLMQMYYSYTDTYEAVIRSIGSENDKLYNYLLKLKSPPMKSFEEKEISSQINKMEEMEDFIKNIFRSK